jgi:hypothetical protein
MVAMGMSSVSKRVIIYESSAFFLIVLLIWFDEMFDLPHLLFGAEPTPINWIESLFESFLVSIVGFVIVYHTKGLFKKLNYLEGIVPICSYCRRIRDEEGSWHQMEAFISDRSEAEFSHGICPECAKEFYPRFSPLSSELDPVEERPTTSVAD